MRRLLISAGLLLLSISSGGSRAAIHLFDLKDNMNEPSAVAMSEDGTAVVLDGMNGRLVLFGADGKRRGEIRGGNREPLSVPMDLAVEGSWIVVADTGNKRLLRVDLDGGNRRIIRLSADDSPPAPVGLTILGRNIYWTDRNNHRICRTTIITGETRTCWGTFGKEDSSFRYPFMLDVDRDGYLHIVDVLNARIQVFNGRGRWTRHISHFGTQPGTLLRPNGIAMDAQDRLFVSDHYLGTISVFRHGKFQGLLRDEAGDVIRLDRPIGMARWRDRLYIVEMGGDRVRVYRLGKMEPKTRNAHTTIGGVPVTRQNCITCHLSWDKRFKPDTPSAVPPVAEQRMCLSCHHGAVVESRPALATGRQHPDYHHSRPDRPFEPTSRRDEPLSEKLPLLKRDTTPYCGSCHTPHFKREEETRLHPGHKNPWMRHNNQRGELCLECHEKHGNRKGEKHPGNHPIQIRLEKPPHPEAKGYARETTLYNGLPDALEAAGARLGRDRSTLCETCHRMHGAVADPLLVLNDRKLCASCHPSQSSNDRREAHRKGVHPVGIKLEKAITIQGEKITEVTCQSCHAVHGSKPGTPLLRKAKGNQLCVTCHSGQHAEGKDDARGKGIHPVNFELETPVTIGDRETRTVECLTCHSVHGGKPDTSALVEDDKTGTLCKICHEKETAVIGTDHDLRETAPESSNMNDEHPKEAGVCGSCHSLHRNKEKSPSLFVGRPLQIAPDKEQRLLQDELCLACHREDEPGQEHIVEHYQHPYRDIVLRSAPDTMPLFDDAGKRSEFGRIACITCHEPHHWSAKADKSPSKTTPTNQEGTILDSFLRRTDPAATFCVDCHGLETRVLFKDFHKKRSRVGRPDYFK